MQKPSHYGFRLSPAFTVASNRKRLCRPPSLCRVLKKNASAAVTVSAAKTNARRLVVAVKDAVAAAGRQTPKKSYKYKFSFFFSDRNS